MDIIRMRAPLTAITALATSPAESSSAPAHGSTVTTGIRHISAAPGITVTATSTMTNIATSDADTFIMASGEATRAGDANGSSPEVGTQAGAIMEDSSTAQ